MAPISSAICETEALSWNDEPQVRRQPPKKNFFFSFHLGRVRCVCGCEERGGSEPSLQSVRHPELLCLINSLAFALCRKSVL